MDWIYLTPPFFLMQKRYCFSQRKDHFNKYVPSSILNLENVDCCAGSGLDAMTNIALPQTRNINSVRHNWFPTR